MHPDYPDTDNEERMTNYLATIASRMENIEFALIVPLEKIESVLSTIQSTLSDIDKSIQDMNNS
jgi:hypothetical protein